MLGNYRSAFKPLKTWLAEPLARTGVSPDIVTLSGIPLSLAAGTLLLMGRPLEALPLAFVSSLTDLVDGEVARLQGRQSHFGNYLEAVVDRVVESILLIALTVLFPLPGAVALAASLIISFTKPRVGLVIITDNHDWPGLGDHSDRMVLIVAAYGLCAFALFSPAVLLWLLALMAGTGAYKRVLYARDLVEKAEHEGQLLPYLQEDQARNENDPRS